ncbi:MAG: hypothetical protein JWO36_957 [Myxococcales bacterium]|nr:hypothetical protein [Myxococcales bacterium]
MTRELRIVGAVPAEGIVRLGSVTELDTLEEVLHWGHAQQPPCDVIDVIVQDEFTHDVLVRAPAGYLCFDTT